MRAILRIDINDWTTQRAGLPKIKRGTTIEVERVKNRQQDYNGDYVGIVKIKNVVYRFDLNKKEFEVIN
jgi:hypothetical protein